MMIMTSYFYQIRFMKPNFIPLSTAKYDPRWYHDFKGQDYVYIDKRGVVNGLRAEPFMPGPQCDGLCHGPETCTEQKMSWNCKFLELYQAQLFALKKDETIARIEDFGRRVKEFMGFEEEPVLVFLFHETPSNPCSERGPFQTWARAMGLEVEEFDYKKLEKNLKF